MIPDTSSISLSFTSVQVAVYEQNEENYAHKSKHLGKLDVLKHLQEYEEANRARIYLVLV